MQTQTAFKPAETTLRGVRVLSVALNLPGPAALMRLANMPPFSAETRIGVRQSHDWILEYTEVDPIPQLTRRAS